MQLWSHCYFKRYLDYQYTKFQLYTFRVQKNVFLHDTRLWFPDCPESGYDVTMWCDVSSVFFDSA